VRVFSTACDCASITSIVSKWRPFSFIFNQGIRERQGGWGMTVMLFLVKKFLGEKENVRRCNVVMRQPILSSPKFRVKSHAFFLKRLSNHCQGLHCSFSEICIKSYAVHLSDPIQRHTRQDTRLQAKERKKSTHPPTCVKFCTLTSKICL
jgi:hypothetical protein